ncbi:hypothetical protein EVI18_16745 [Salmonella enterica subsp. enterica]|uniref:Uncharacterized protein n=6 Tax=Salmonella enterica TaxID=28901 RepID=A0A3U3ABK2_SALPT|nr:hypothetical protein CO694_16090 [Salmonella enterica subsp. enterica serovar Paratyphi A]AXR39239.1 hypothetical protein CO195_14720 [Salmonella enterica subsp. enterica]EAA2976767.1 hypothetical protein [Salmonella enterica subsp. enterica serovar Mbao]EAA6273541.1 hypothetical protein [Salmonella enterica subsp. enterica serovar Telhashomer]EAA6784751.1 hypothetical protein [Salmonella enterica subsp. enterica serovar Braenderup]EAA9006065.1 hypothetical protein [Salmonella enterica subs
MRLSAGRPASQVDRVVIPEVLIGEIIRYALRTCLLHQPARMRRFFFEPILLSLLLRNSCNLPQFMF